MAASWSDSPIEAKRDDEFGRAPYAVKAAALIAASHSWDDSIVFGLTGPWGSGKSSMLAMIAEELAASNKTWRVARFTPWATHDVSGLLGDFYASLSAALPKKRGKQVRSALGVLAQVSAPAAAAIPWGGGAVEAMVKAGGEAILDQEPWEQAFQRAVNELEKLNTPVLVIADDIDRLQSEELFALLKVVRLLGRFPGVHYLLAYDEATLFKSLSGTGMDSESDSYGAQFMEKIVQYPLIVPPLLSTQLMARLDRGLDAALTETGRPLVLSPRLGGLVEVFRSQLFTPRAIDRYLAQLRHHLPLVDPQEINDEDVIVLTLLRTLFPLLYLQLPRWRDQLISGHSGEMKPGVSSSGIEYEDFDTEALFGSIPERSRDDARTLLLDLFPKLNRKSYNSYGNAARRIGDARYFDRYFAMGIPEHDVSDVEVAEAVSRAARGRGAELETLLTGAGTDLVLLVIDKATSQSLPADASEDVELLAILATVIPLVDRVPQNASFFRDPPQQILRWAALLLSTLSDDVAADLVTEVIRSAPSLVRQLQIVQFTDARDRVPACWKTTVVPTFFPEVIDALLTHVRAGDDASEQDGPGTFIHFLVTHNQSGPAAVAIEEGIANREFSLEDLAARFVIRHRIMGVNARWELGDFNQESFNKLAPEGPDQFYDLPVAQVDEYDTSWTNRRAYVAGRVKQPPHRDHTDTFASGDID